MAMQDTPGAYLFTTDLRASPNPIPPPVDLFFRHDLATEHVDQITGANQGAVEGVPAWILL